MALPPGTANILLTLSSSPEEVLEEIKGLIGPQLSGNKDLVGKLYNCYRENMESTPVTEILPKDANVVQYHRFTYIVLIQPAPPNNQSHIAPVHGNESMAGASNAHSVNNDVPPENDDKSAARLFFIVAFFAIVAAIWFGTRKKGPR